MLIGCTITTEVAPNTNRGATSVEGDSISPIF